MFIILACTYRPVGLQLPRPVFFYYSFPKQQRPGKRFVFPGTLSNHDYISLSSRHERMPRYIRNQVNANF